MNRKIFVFVMALAALFFAGLAWGISTAKPATAADAPEFTSIITGRVTAEDGGDMGEVVVELQPGVGYVTTTVVNAQGFYTFTLPDQRFTQTFGLRFNPNWSTGSFLLPYIYPQAITLQAGEVRHGVDATLRVGGKLTGDLVDAYMKATVPITSYFIIARQPPDPLATFPDYMISSAGVISQGTVYAPGDYWPTGAITTTRPIHIAARTTTSTTFIYDDPAWRIMNVLTVPGMPNILGITTPGDHRLLLSKNAGSTFERILYPPGYVSAKQSGVMLTQRGVADAAVRAIMSEPDYPSPFYDFHLQRSGDLGQSWATISPTLLSCDGADPSGVSRHNSFANVLLSPRQSQRAYALGKCRYFSFQDGIYETTPFYQLYMSDDFGLTWERRFSLGFYYPPPQLVLSLVEKDGIYLAKQTYDGPLAILQSHDAGQNWITTTTPMSTTGFELFTLVADGGLSNTLYALSPDQHLRVSDDGGATWAERTLPPACLGSLLAVPGQTGHLLMTCAPAVYRSRNGGQSWQKLATPGRGVFVDYANPGRIYLEKYKDLWVSDDEGDIWQPVWNVPGAKKRYLPVVFK